jgi:hypothetical protein
MKTKVLLLLVCSLVVSLISFAQEGLHAAIFGIAQSKTIVGDFFVKTFPGNDIALKKEFAIGYQAGVAIGYGFSDNMGVNLGARYSVQGQSYADYKEVENDLTYTFKRSVELNYLKIPVHFTYIVEPTDAITFSAFAGFYYAMLLSYSDKTSFQYSSSQGTLFDGTATVSQDDYKWDYTDHGVHSLETFHLTSQPYKKSDFGLSAGAGIVLKLSDMIYVPVMLTYELGLADIKNHSAAKTEYNATATFWDETTDGNLSEKYHNSSVGAMIGLKFLIDELAGY